LAVGDDAGVRALAGRNTRMVDLGGRLALPGLTDAHFHYRDWALGRRRLSPADTASLSDLRVRVAHRASEIPAGCWILGQGWNETRWPEPRIPTRADLDDIPMIEKQVVYERGGWQSAVAVRWGQESGFTLSERADCYCSRLPGGLRRLLYVSVSASSGWSAPKASASARSVTAA